MKRHPVENLVAMTIAGSHPRVPTDKDGRNTELSTEGKRAECSQQGTRPAVSLGGI